MKCNSWHGKQESLKPNKHFIISSSPTIVYSIPNDSMFLSCGGGITKHRKMLPERYQRICIFKPSAGILCSPLLGFQFLAELPGAYEVASRKLKAPKTHMLASSGVPSDATTSECDSCLSINPSVCIVASRQKHMCMCRHTHICMQMHIHLQTRKHTYK